MNKTFSLIVDGHNFYFRTLYTLTKSKGEKLLDTEEDQNIFSEKLVSDWFYTINKYKEFIDDIIFVIDSKSWRKDMILPNEYKGNRSANEERINFNNFYTIIEEFNNLLINNGIKVSRANYCEGDDLIFGWSTYLKSINKPYFILSTDKDLTQLLDSELLSAQYNPVQNTLFVTKQIYDILEERKSRISKFGIEDLFNSDVITKTEFESFISSSKCQLQIVDPEVVRFNKTISGDAGDNVMSVYRKQTESGRMLGIGDKKCEKIFEEFKSALNEDTINYEYYIQEYSDKNKLLDIIYQVCKINDPSFTKRMLQENINTNGKLVILSSSIIPDYVLDKINENINSLKNVKLLFNPKNNSKEFWYNQTRFKDKISGSIIKQKANSLKFIKDEDDFSFLTD